MMPARAARRKAQAGAGAAARHRHLYLPPVPIMARGHAMTSASSRSRGVRPDVPAPERPPLPRIGELQRYFAERPELGAAAVYLFGSHAEARAHRESDVDLGVLLGWAAQPTADDRFAVRLRLLGELEGVVAPAAPDIVILNDAPPMLGRHVIWSGIRIFMADAAADHAYVRDVQLRAADLAPWLRRMRQLKLEWLARPSSQ
jgi:predicted nucleotidyltransferase